MRMLLKIQLPVERANVALKDGTLQKTLESLLGELKPEAAYFLAEDGKRTALIFFDLQEPAQIPVVAEPPFQALHASVQLTPVMTSDELRAGLRKALG